MFMYKPDSINVYSNPQTWKIESLCNPLMLDEITNKKNQRGKLFGPELNFMQQQSVMEMK